MWEAYAVKRGIRYVQVALSQILELVEAGELGRHDLVRRVGQTRWMTVEELQRRYAGTIRERGIARLRRGSEDAADLEMTPMIDMTFLLLIFFMLTASFHIQKSLDIPAEQKGQAPTVAQLARDAVVVRITADDRVLLVGPDGGTQEVELEDLADTLRERVSRARRPFVVVDAHDRARHETFVQVVDAAYRAGIEDVRLAVPVTSPTR